jgi:hypothetical protein
VETNGTQMVVASHATDVITSEPDLVVRPAARRRRRFVLIGLFALAIIVIAAVLFWRSQSSGGSTAVGTVTLTTTPGGPVVTLTNGTLDRDQLRNALVKDGHGAYFVPAADGGYELTADLVVGSKGHLNINNTALLLESDAKTHVRISSEGGSAMFRQDTIASWNNGAVDTNLSDGRADIVAEGNGSRLDFTDSTVSFLGANANDPGVSWRNGGAGVVVGSSFTSDYRGAYAYKSGRIVVSDSTFSSNGETGFLMLYPGAGTTVKTSQFNSNVANGLEVDQATAPYVDDVQAGNNGGVGLVIDNGQDARVAKAQLHDNKQQGMTLTGPTGVLISSSKIWSNSTGITVSGGSATVQGTDLSGNITDGLYETGPTTRLVMTGDRLDHNDRSGLYITDGSGTITGSLVDTNGSGIYVAGASAAIVAHGNTVEGSIKDGVALTGINHVTLSGNTISKSGDAALSVAAKTNLTPIIKSNTIVIVKGKAAVVSRVRAS